MVARYFIAFLKRYNFFSGKKKILYKIIHERVKQKAPMATTPIISVPYERLACDLVGPLPRTKRGFKYILTVI